MAGTRNEYHDDDDDDDDDEIPPSFNWRLSPTHSRPFAPHFVRRRVTRAFTYQNERSLDQVYVHEADGRAVRSQAAPCVCCPGTT